MARVIIFDRNETLLDPSAPDPYFQEIFGAAAVREAWFKQVIESALVATVTDTYAPFDTIQRAALTMMVARQGFSPSKKDTASILSRSRDLPAYPDVKPALDLLQ